MLWGQMYAIACVKKVNIVQGQQEDLLSEPFPWTHSVLPEQRLILYLF